MKSVRKILCAAMAFVMAFALMAPAFAADTTSSQERTQGYTYDAPTSPIAIDDNIITATAHRAASPVLGMLGVNATSGFGMINGGAPADFEAAQACAALGIWGTSLNENPDPYYWNYFYNFYAAANNKELSTDALINDDVAASPGAADGNLQEKYGNVSVSLSTRPQIVVGVSGTGLTDGYDEQLKTINSFTSDSPYYQQGDENYSPKLVSYQMTTIREMMDSVQRLADAITEVEKETGKTTRYGDVQVISGDYEKYVYGIIAYVHSQLAAKSLEQKTVAVITAINEDGTYTLADSLSSSTTSLSRAYEYCLAVTDSLVDKIGGTTATLDQLLTADCMVTISTQGISSSVLQESFGSKTFDGIIVSNIPNTLYGMTMNSVENAMGYAYVIGSIYSDVIDISPVELCAYFYEHFLHISDRAGVEQVVKTNFSETILPKGITSTLPASYSAAKIEGQILTGMQYFVANTSKFSDAESSFNGLSNWVVNYGSGIGSSYKATCVKSAQAFTMNSAAATPEAYNIDGNNYVKLRDIAKLLNDTTKSFSITTSGTTVITATGQAYTAVGGELEIGEDKSSTCVYSTWTLTVDGNDVSCMVYNIGGNNYFKLRDLGTAFGLEIGFDSATNTATITA